MPSSSSPTGSSAVVAQKEPEPIESPEEALSRCLLSQYRFCVAGVGLGTAYAVQTKGTKGYGLFPMVVGGVVGSAADLVYGYTVACTAERERLRVHNSREHS